MKEKEIAHHSLVSSDNVADASGRMQIGEVPCAGAGTAVDYERVRRAVDSDVGGPAGE
jgi:hypothetical protein